MDAPESNADHTEVPIFGIIRGVKAKETGAFRNCDHLISRVEQDACIRRAENVMRGYRGVL